MFLPGTDVMNFENIFAEQIGEKNWRFLLKLLFEDIIITSVFQKSGDFFRQKLAKGQKL
jgi:hypothetical protein